jgi:hypothetical protein
MLSFENSFGLNEPAEVFYILCDFCVDWISKMATTMGHSSTKILMGK